MSKAMRFELCRARQGTGDVVVNGFAINFVIGATLKDSWFGRTIDEAVELVPQVQKLHYVPANLRDSFDTLLASIDIYFKDRIVDGTLELPLSLTLEVGT